MREEIIKLIEDNPKHYGKMIRRNSEMMKWIEKNKKNNTENFSLMLYCTLHDNDTVCKYGKEKKFYGINKGFRNCGSAANCACTKEQVSRSVKITKSNISTDEQKIINEKREKTNLEKYGVKNIGQTDFAKQKHQEFYMNSDNVRIAVDKFKNSMSMRYDADNPQKIKLFKEKSEQTLLNKYGVTNALKLESTKQAGKRSREINKKNGVYLQLGYNKFVDYVRSTFNFEVITSFEEYNGIQQKDAYYYRFKCLTCNTEVDKKFYHARGINCEICNKKSSVFVSNEEQEIFDFITKTLDVQNGIQSDRKLINPYELDMIFPDQKIAIEYCGLFWHSELSSGKHRKYHQTKMNLANTKGWRLITIFSDEWTNKTEIVKSRLRHIFGKNTVKYYARQLNVVDLSTAESNNFLNFYHIQGSAVSKFKYGLKTKDGALVATMTFSRGRKALNSNDEYELVRYATNGSSVIGGADKLLQHFIKTVNPTQIATYADLRWSDGNLYEKLGFIKHKSPQPGYWYVKSYSTRYHRYNFTKRKLVEMGGDVSHSEWDIMQSLNYDRIWDCGHQKYYLTIS